MSWNKYDLKLLAKYAAGRKFIMETGGGGLSTSKLARVARKYDSIMVSIEVDSNRVHTIEGVDHQVGWSISYDDIIKKDDSRFMEEKKKYPYMDRDVAMIGEEYMKGEKDLIRKSLARYNSVLDFFFCDTGAYCGLAEWNIVKSLIPVGGIFVCHDIYYPKSIKCFQVAQDIKRSKQWKILKKTSTKQGLLIAIRIDNKDI